MSKMDMTIKQIIAKSMVPCKKRKKKKKKKRLPINIPRTT
jgi:hypothetical protein